MLKGIKCLKKIKKNNNKANSNKKRHCRLEIRNHRNQLEKAKQKGNRGKDKASIDFAAFVMSSSFLLSTLF